MLRLRRKRRWGADHIAHEVGLAASTVHSILNGAGLGRLDVGDRATDREPVRRYQRERPGELIHIDVKKLSGIPDGGGWRIHGRGQAPTVTRSSVGYRFIHSAVDDRTRLAYSEILDDEQAATAAGFWHRAHAFFAADVNGTYLLKGTHSGQWALRVSADIDASLTAASRPPRDTGYPQWAYIRPWTSETQRATYYRGFLHFYNHHRSHGALSWATPIDTLTRLAEDSLPEEHT